MTLANPNIDDVTVNYDGSSTQVLILSNNSDGYGYQKLDVISGGVVKGSDIRCVNIRQLPFYSKTSVYLSGLVQPIDYVKAYRCSTDTNQNCSVIPPTCSSMTLTDSFYSGMYAISTNNTPPGMPSGLAIVPGDGNLNIKWNNVSDPSGISSVFAYYLIMEDAGTTVVVGHVLNTNRNITIGGLTNGKTYTIQVQAVSHSNVAGSQATGSGTPIAPCTQPSCTFTIP